MRFSSYALPALAANLVAAMPRPQDIDLDMVIDTPDPTYSEQVGVAAQTVTYDTASLIAAATSAVSSVSVEISDVLSQTAVVSKRAATTTCAPQPSGATSAPTYAAGSDNAANFLANTYYASVASAAPTPSGYTQAFVAQQASNNAFGYMGYDTFDTYDVATCAQRCTAKNGCVSINMYFERDPSVNPDDSSCSNPSSVTMIKCVYWGGPISQDSAVNTGQIRGGFTVAIAGSNGYVTTQIKTPDGYQAGIPYGKYAINAPYDAQGYNTFMGSKIFTSTWDTAACAAYCDSQTAYNKATAPKDGTPYKICNFYNTYVLTAYKADGSVVPQGQYCALYTEAWPIKYATNGGQWRGQDQYLVSYSFGFPKANPGIDPTVGDANGAKYQAVADIKWSSLQPFCSTLLGYSNAVSSVTATIATTTVFTSSSATTTTVTQDLPYKKRQAAQTTPAGLAKYQASVLSGACSLVVASPTGVSTTTVATSVVTSTSTTVIAAIQTAVVCDPPSGSPYTQRCGDRTSCTTQVTCTYNNDPGNCFFGSGSRLLPGVLGGVWYGRNHQCILTMDCCGSHGMFASLKGLKARDTIYTNESAPVIPGAEVYIVPGVELSLPDSA
ncbi:hypothetical protein E4T50_03130 [Aureobasidium sp. EXF-12298]|nr:hypothetical protein E4T50_03130 [Aureobasidium sp. EXF-12298]KAI4759597.1 hypothetical protein E4T51_07387 [Aureobasidium sp. EXF-12344]KAI4781817.1 hypothetical protein E4T52_03268 [Aureobasidium sp. EXF-3400]